MFIHIFRYRLLTLMRDRTLIFWTMIFPLVLATFFNMSLRNVGQGENFKIINIGVVDDNGYKSNIQFQDTIKEFSQGDNAMFNLNILTEEMGRDKLLEGEISGLLFIDRDIKVLVNQSGMNQSIIKIFLDHFSQTSSAITNIIMENPESITTILKNADMDYSFSKEVPISEANPDSALTYFYALIAMACLYGSFFGLGEVTNIQADLSDQAARMNLVPIHKLKLFLYSSFSSLVIQFVEMIILLCYLQFVLKISFGDKINLVILTIFIGSILGISMGAFIGAVGKGNENAKVGVCIGATMTGSFLAGMMFGDIKYLVAKNVPILSFINPVNVLSDSFFALYFYDSYEKYFMNITILIGFSVIFCLITYLKLRRSKYASI